MLTYLLHMVIFHGYVNLPEGRGLYELVYWGLWSKPIMGIFTKQIQATRILGWEHGVSWPIKQYNSHAKLYHDLCCYTSIRVYTIFLQLFHAVLFSLHFILHTSTILFTGLIPVWFSGICINMFIVYLDPPSTHRNKGVLPHKFWYVPFFWMVFGGSRYVPQWK